MTATNILSQFRRKNRVKKLMGHLHTEELIYAHMFETALVKKGIQTPPFFPIGGAANYSLLYLILRILTEMPVSNTLELGIGQSTLLLDALGAQGHSVEHDAVWANIIRERVTSRKIVTAPLLPKQVLGSSTHVYDFAPAKYDFVIVDGPQGSKRNSRWGSLDILNDHLEEEFIVIFDDAERKGEQDTARAFANARKVKLHMVSGLSSQCIAYTPKFSGVGWF